MQKRVSTFTLINSLVIALIFSIIILWNLNNLIDKHNEAKTIELKTLYIVEQKQLIKSEVNRLTKRIKGTRKAALKSAKIRLQERVISAENFIKNLKDSGSQRSREEMIELMTKSFKWNDNSGYFYLISEDGTVLNHGTSNKLLGKNITVLKNEFPPLYNFLKKAYNHEGIFGEYEFTKKGHGEKRFKKVSYAKYSPELKMLIGAATYISTVDKVVQKQIVAGLEKVRFSYNNYGYFWIMNTKADMIFHIDKRLYEKNHMETKDIHGVPLFKNIVDIAQKHGEGYTEYLWVIPNTDRISRKIAYLRYVPEWDWILGSGFYFENLAAQIAKDRQIGEQVLSDSIEKNSLIIFLLFAVVSIASLGIYKRIRYIEDLQETHINDLEQYQRAIDKSSLVSITDNEGYIIYVNDRLCETTGFRKDEIIGKSYIDIAHPDTPESMYTELIETVLKGKIWKGILKNITASGGYFYQESTVTPFKEKDGSIQKYICISHDVTEVFENKSKLQQSLHLDTLTGLGNRARLIAVLNNAHSANLALLDIDKFHQINETFGMKRGDRLLKDFSERLSKHNQIKNYQFFRIHSDVFAAISLSSAPDAFISNIESAIADITKTTFSIKDQEIILQLKIGHSHGAQNNLAHADAALQFAKTNNMDSFSYDSSVLNKTDVYERHTRVVKMLSNAIEDDRIVPYFQPIKGCISAANKYECLIRLIDEDKSVISPAEFLDISKQTRFYPVLTKIMVKKSIDYFANHPAEFSINLSPQDITNTETMNFIFKYAVDNGVMKKMILEIVESEEFSKSDEVESLLSRFKNAGARIAIDDFGSGYSNFDYLIKIKADFIKIDGGITKLINKDSRAKDIAQSIVSYAKKLNMQTIAEFVSDEELAQATKEMGIDFQQGYYIGKPDKEAK